MSESAIATDRLDSWKEIASYLGRNVRTVIRWEKEKGLPVRRIPGGQRQAVYAYAHELDAWLMSRSEEPSPTVTPATEAAHQPAPTPVPPENSGASAEAPPKALPIRRWLPLSTYWIVCVLGGAAILACAAFLVHWFTANGMVQFTAVTQLTNDGTSKTGLVADAQNLYFGEIRDGKTVLSEVSVSGGPIHSIPTPLTNAIPEGISPDGSRLLVLDREGQEQERALWIVPTNGSKPSRLGSVLCHSAAWSPDGRRIAFADGNSIYLASETGAKTERLETFATVPDLLRWSRDGRRLLFELRDNASWRSSFWEIDLSGDGDEVSALIPLHVSLAGCCSALTQPNEYGQSFVGGWDSRLHGVLLLGRKRGFWNSRFYVASLAGGVEDISGLATDPRENKLFAISDSASAQSYLQAGEVDLIRFDRSSGTFTPFLPGVSAHDVDFSPDRHWVVYIEIPNNTLWVSRPDGTDARQIPFPESNMELPRWSPDGKQIAFMAQLPGEPWRIFVVSRQGGQATEASTGTDSQGAPTWSPDGKWLVYGNVWCQETDSCAIHKIDVATRQEFIVPGSEGLGTARWSPDGHYIAALQPVGHQVWMLDMQTGAWRKLADGINGNDLSWSADSRYIFASIPNGGRPKIVRISLDGEMKTAVDLSSFSRMAGRIDTWFTLAPDKSIIFLHWFQPNEIYALSYSER